MPVAGPRTMVDEREDGNDFVDDRLSSSFFWLLPEDLDDTFFFFLASLCL
jgi:hypothetical protein